jgi:hypothetical protein
MWTAGEVFRLYFLPRRSRRGLLPSHRQVIPFPDDICARLFSLAPDLRFDRRDIDYGRARRCRSIFADHAGRACAPLGADTKAARSGAERNRRDARHRALGCPAMIGEPASMLRPRTLGAPERDRDEFMWPRHRSSVVSPVALPHSIGTNHG